MIVKEYEELIDGLVPISFVDGEFKDIKFTIGKVKLSENETKTNLVVNFDLNVIDDISLKQYNKFKNYVGEYIVHQIDNGDIIFSNGTGGTFEN